MKSQKEFFKMWPDLFEQTKYSSFFCCPPGWSELVWGLCEEIEQELQGDFEDLKLTTVKEKFGTLRVYAASQKGVPENISSLISEAESLSSKLCLRCGSEEGVTTEGPGWVSTLCKRHRDVMDEGKVNDT